MANDVIERLKQVQRTPGSLGVSTFRAEGTLDANSPGERSLIAEFTAGTVHAIRDDLPFPVAVPAYEKFVTDGTADNAETFNLSHDLLDAPYVESIAVWNGGSLVQPDSVDYDADAFTITDAGTASNLHVYYISSAPATIEIVKATPSGQNATTGELYSSNLGLVHTTNQSEQPETFEFSHNSEPFVAQDMKVQIYLNAPYQVRFEDADGDGSEPTNALLEIPVFRGKDTVPGLGQLIKAEMGQR